MPLVNRDISWALDNFFKRRPPRTTTLFKLWSKPPKKEMMRLRKVPINLLSLFILCNFVIIRHISKNNHADRHRNCIHSKTADLKRGKFIVFLDDLFSIILTKINVIRAARWKAQKNDWYIILQKDKEATVNIDKFPVAPYYLVYMLHLLTLLSWVSSDWNWHPKLIFVNNSY